VEGLAGDVARQGRGQEHGGAGEVVDVADAAQGHDVAVGLIVQGLRRRLSGAGHPTRGEIGPWLDGIAPSVRTPRGRTALDTLVTLTRRPASAQDVLSATDAVETLWEELTPK